MTGVGADREARNASAYAKIQEHPAAAVLKLADRIANVEASRGWPEKLEMYQHEWPSFARALVGLGNGSRAGAPSARSRRCSARYLHCDDASILGDARRIPLAPGASDPFGAAPVVRGRGEVRNSIRSCFPGHRCHGDPIAHQ